MIEPFGPEYAEPPAARADCPDCGCCSARLCERGRSTVMTCAGLTAGPAETVADCPCSGELTAGTMSWRLARSRAARRASERPFPRPVEDVLRAAANGRPVDASSEQARALVLLHYLAPGRDDGSLVLTEFGRVYLMTVDHPRYLSPLLVVSVDTRSRLAQVLVEAWSNETAVTVPADQLVAALGGGDISSLPGARLMCSANTWAETADDVVLTAVQVPPMPEPSPLAAPGMPGAASTPPPAAIPAAAPPPPGALPVDATMELPVLPAAPPAPPAAAPPPEPGALVVDPVPPVPPFASAPGVAPGEASGVLPLSGRFVRIDRREDPRA